MDLAQSTIYYFKTVFIVANIYNMKLTILTIFKPTIQWHLI